MQTATLVIKQLNSIRDPVKAKNLAWFFKTGKGQYGEGDIFLGITVPAQRAVAKQHISLPLPEIKKLLQSKIHEHRFTSLEILVMQFERGSEAVKKQIFNFYLKNSQNINNWDLVDTSAPYIVGEYLLNRPRAVLYKLAASKNLWQRRIAIVGTFGFINKDDYFDSLQLAKILLPDKHDLIHKAVGWMLREIGKRDRRVLEDFIKANFRHMSRTTLRYAIERFPENLRRQYLAMR